MTTPSPEEQDLRALLASSHAVLLAAIRDEARFLALLRNAAWSMQYPVWTWSAPHGLARDNMPNQVNTVDPRGALGFIRELSEPGVFVMLDASHVLKDEVCVRLIKEIGLKHAPGQTVVLTGPEATVPPDLAGVALAWRLEPPGRDELRGRITALLDQVRAAHLTVDPSVDVEKLVDAVAGLSAPEAERLILREAFAGGGLADADLASVRDAKAQLLATDGALELVPVSVTMSDVGGLENIKAWLTERGRGFEPAARDFGIEPPRGVLITGVPGCGKSLIAKALAASWGLPLALLDPGRIYGSYVGESEERLRDTLAAVGVMAPVVLWIDEIEKGFAKDAGGDSGVSARVLGTFLRWLQDRPHGIFIVATANDVEKLPPELLRRGRFDEIFFVDLPRPDERAEILTAQLRRRRRDPAAFDLDAVVAATDGFSGAELEGVVIAALYSAFAEGGQLDTARLVAEAEQTVPLSVTRAEDVLRIRLWAQSRAVRASAEVAPASAEVVAAPATTTDPRPPDTSAGAAAVDPAPSAAPDPGLVPDPPAVAAEPVAAAPEPPAVTPEPPAFPTSPVVPGH